MRWCWCGCGIWGIDGRPMLYFRGDGQFLGLYCMGLGKGPVM